MIHFLHVPTAAPLPDRYPGGLTGSPAEAFYAAGWLKDSRWLDYDLSPNACVGIQRNEHAALRAFAAVTTVVGPVQRIIAIPDSGVTYAAANFVTAHRVPVYGFDEYSCRILYYGRLLADVVALYLAEDRTPEQIRLFNDVFSQGYWCGSYNGETTLGIGGRASDSTRPEIWAEYTDPVDLTIQVLIGGNLWR